MSVCDYMSRLDHAKTVGCCSVPGLAFAFIVVDPKYLVLLSAVSTCVMVDVRVTRCRSGLTVV